MSSFRKFLKILLGIIFIPLLVYLLLVIIGAIIPVNFDSETKDPEYRIYLVSNGIHTDIVLPVNTAIINWTNIVKPQHTLSLSPGESSDYNLISFGWGDLGFYRDTPQWEDLTLETGFNALFLKTPSAVHARFLSGVSEGDNTRSILVDSTQLSNLSIYIKDSFEYSAAGNIQPVNGLHYTRDDAFYKATGSLHLFNTCNTWVNNGLKNSGIKACLWTPFVEGIFIWHP